MALVLWQLLRHHLLRYQHLKLYLIAYGVFRFATEYLRPELALWLGLTFYQWVSLALILGLSVQWVMDQRRLWRERHVPGPAAATVEAAA
jgi:prolipoprotein diacylglyceryltransferase